MYNRLLILLIALIFFLPLNAQERDLTIEELAHNFATPKTEYGAYVWWHWMGSNFSKEGITKDLEAMKEAGIGGATIFNLTSAVMESEYLLGNNPWQERTYRSDYYWEALEWAAAEAERLGLKIGLHNCPGYSTTGGDWITDERAMKRIVLSKVKLTGGADVDITLPKPTLPTFSNWSEPKRTATSYWDVEVVAVPISQGADASKVLTLTKNMDEQGRLKWNAPEGEWMIYRIGYAPTMAMPHPVPDELSGKTLEVDKFSREHNIFHWDNVLQPLVEHLKPYIGKSFTHILVDSYEAGYQDWNEDFREEFISRKGYDPIPWIALKDCFGEKATQQYVRDNREVINSLFVEKSWQVAREKINEAGLEFYIEPYDWMNQFDIYDSALTADVPMSEFWNLGDGWLYPQVIQAAKDRGKKIVAAEAYTGRPESCMYTEDPAMLKHSTDGAFHHGANRFFLHHWVHQPFDDKYQPGMGMGWWGTHFGRHQTWIKPAKAFFTYLSRCQMLLQQGELVEIYDNVLHRRLEDAELFFVHNPSREKAMSKWVECRGAKGTPQIWDADSGTIRHEKSFTIEEHSTQVKIELLPDEALFVVFPREGNYGELIRPDYQIVGQKEIAIEGEWKVSFDPKLDKKFVCKFPTLEDFSLSNEERIKYFAGTATYHKNIDIDRKSDNQRILLDLGEMNDIAQVWVNGKDAGVSWYAPFVVDITPYVKSGRNTLKIAVSNNWANRLIGDEQHPADFEWGIDRGESMGRGIKSLPEWFIKDEPRPEQGRKTFNIWYYYRPTSTLQKAGLVGPVKIVVQDIETSER